MSLSNVIYIYIYILVYRVIKNQPPPILSIELDHNPFKCPADGCSKSFRKASLLHYHIKYYHSDQPPDEQPETPRWVFAGSIFIQWHWRHGGLYFLTSCAVAGGRGRPPRGATSCPTARARNRRPVATTTDNGALRRRVGWTVLTDVCL